MCFVSYRYLQSGNSGGFDATLICDKRFQPTLRPVAAGGRGHPILWNRLPPSFFVCGEPAKLKPIRRTWWVREESSAEMSWGKFVRGELISRERTTDRVGIRIKNEHCLRKESTITRQAFLGTAHRQFGPGATTYQSPAPSFPLILLMMCPSQYSPCWKFRWCLRRNEENRTFGSSGVSGSLKTNG